MEIFGETPFTPENQPEALTLSESQQKTILDVIDRLKKEFFNKI